MRLASNPKPSLDRDKSSRRLHWSNLWLSLLYSSIFFLRIFTQTIRSRYHQKILNLTNYVLQDFGNWTKKSNTQSQGEVSENRDEDQSIRCCNSPELDRSWTNTAAAAGTVAAETTVVAVAAVADERRRRCSAAEASVAESETVIEVSADVAVG